MPPVLLLLPAIVPLLNTRRVKSADLNEVDSNPASNLVLSILTEVEVKEATVVEKKLLDAIKAKWH